jgi:hypothetical protein
MQAAAAQGWRIASQLAQPGDQPFDGCAWGGRDLKMGTVRGAVRQLGIEWSAFQNA